MAGYTDIPPSYFDTLIARPGEILADTAVGVIEGGRKLEDKLAKARDIYNTTEDYLDEGLARVGDLFDRSPPMMAGGPMSRAGYRHSPLVYEPYTEAEMGSSPYQETDTGPGLMMSGGPMARNGYRHHLAGNAPPNAYFPNHYSEMTQDEKDLLQKEHMQRIHTGLGTLYPGEAADRYYNRDTRSDWQKWKESTESGRR